MQNKQARSTNRFLSWCTIIVFFVFSVMPFPGYAADWNGIDRSEQDGKVIFTAAGDHTIDLESFDQGVNDNWEFNLNGSLLFNITGSGATTWSGKTDVFGGLNGGLLGLFNRNGVHFSRGSEINLHNADFIGAALKSVDGVHFKGYEGEGDNKVFSGGYLLNEGKISGTGNVGLLGRAVENKGTIDLPANKIHLAAGDAMTVGLSGDNLVSVDVTEAVTELVRDSEGNPLKDQIKNSGNITGNKISLTAKGVDSIFEKAINLKGEVKAVDVKFGEDGMVEFVALDDIYNDAVLKASKVQMNTNGKIENAGTIDAKEFKEHGYTFKSTGTLKGGSVSMNNTDGAGYLSGTINVAEVSDVGDIIIDHNVILGRDVSITADADGIGGGSITFEDGVSLSGNGHNLTLKASGQSVIRSMDNLADLTLVGQTAGAEFNLRRSLDLAGDLAVNSNAQLTGGFNVTVRGGDVTGAGEINMTGGTFAVFGTGQFGGNKDWFFNELQFGDGTAEGSTSKTGANKITAGNRLHIMNNHTLKAGNSLWDLTWNGGYLTGIKKVASSELNSLAIRESDGAVFSWGTNPFSFLGNGTSGASNMPVQVSGVGGVGFLTGVTDISIGQMSLALKGVDARFSDNDGSVYAWGTNNFGLLGTNNANMNTSALTPVRVSGVNGVGYLTGVSQIAAGVRQNLALRASDGQVLSWGSNTYGSLGTDVAGATALAPVLVKGEGGTGYLNGVTQIAAGSLHSMALKGIDARYAGNDGSVYTWGYNGAGQIGDGTRNPNFNTVHQQFAYHVRDESGTGYLTGIREIAAAGDNSTALRDSDGSVFVWGSNLYGQAGNGSLATSYVTLPSRVKDSLGTGYLTGVDHISLGRTTVYALKEGKVFSWGSNQYGYLGSDQTGLANSALPVAVKGVNGDGILSGIKQISGPHAIRESDGALFGWGDSAGNGRSASLYHPVATLQVNGLGTANLSGIKKVVGGAAHTLALTDGAGDVYAWGANGKGTLGDGTNIDSYTPIRVLNAAGTGYLTGIKDIVAGNDFSLALENGGQERVYSWGDAVGAGLKYGLAYYQAHFGDDSYSYTTLPKFVLDGSNNPISGISEIAAGFALRRSDGRVYAWGAMDRLANYDGMFTMPCGGGCRVFQNARDYADFVRDDAGNAIEGNIHISYEMALHSSGKVYTWAYNMANGSSNFRSYASFAKIDANNYLTGITKISSGGNHRLALSGSDGSVYAWGNNSVGQIGNGNVGSAVLYAAQVKDGLGAVMTGFSDVAAGNGTSYGLKGGNVYAWGSNYGGALGNGSQGASSAVPVLVRNFNNTGNLSNVTSLDAGRRYAGFAVQEDGTVAGWGLNLSGNLGNNTTQAFNIPVHAKTLIYEPFLNEGTFDAQYSTFTYSGEFGFGGAVGSTKIADNTLFNNLTLRNRVEDYIFRGAHATEDGLKEITNHELKIQGITKKFDHTIMSESDLKLNQRKDFFKFMFESGHANAAEFFSLLFQAFGGRDGTRSFKLGGGSHDFNIRPQDLGLDSGFDNFQKTIFSAQPKPLSERKDKNPAEQTGASFANIMGPVKVVAEDGTIYDAKEGMSLQKGDQVWTGAGARVELATQDGKNVVTVKENSAVSVDKNTSEQTSAPEDLLKIAFGKVSVAVSGNDSGSKFVVQTPNGISGNRG